MYDKYDKTLFDRCDAKNDISMFFFNLVCQCQNVTFQICNIVTLLS